MIARARCRAALHITPSYSFLYARYIATPSPPSSSARAARGPRRVGFDIFVTWALSTRPRRGWIAYGVLSAEDARRPKTNSWAFSSVDFLHCSVHRGVSGADSAPPSRWRDDVGFASPPRARSPGTGRARRRRARSTPRGARRRLMRRSEFSAGVAQKKCSRHSDSISFSWRYVDPTSRCRAPPCSSSSAPTSVRPRKPRGARRAYGGHSGVTPRRALPTKMRGRAQDFGARPCARASRCRPRRRARPCAATTSQPTSRRRRRSVEKRWRGRQPRPRCAGERTGALRPRLRRARAVPCQAPASCAAAPRSTCGGVPLDNPRAIYRFVGGLKTLLDPSRGVAVFDHEGGWPFGLETTLRRAARFHRLHFYVRRGPLWTNFDYVLSAAALEDDVSNDPLQASARASDALLVAFPAVVGAGLVAAQSGAIAHELLPRLDAARKVMAAYLARAASCCRFATCWRSATRPWRRAEPAARGGGGPRAGAPPLMMAGRRGGGGRSRDGGRAAAAAECATHRTTRSASGAAAAGGGAGGRGRRRGRRRRGSRGRASA